MLVGCGDTWERWLVSERGSLIRGEHRRNDKCRSVDTLLSPEPIILPGYYLFSHCHMIITSHNSPDRVNCVVIMLYCSITQLMNLCLRVSLNCGHYDIITIIQIFLQSSNIFSEPRCGCMRVWGTTGANQETTGTGDTRLLLHHNTPPILHWLDTTTTII